MQGFVCRSARWLIPSLAACAIVATAALCLHTSPASAQRPPNIIIIYDEYSCAVDHENEAEPMPEIDYCIRLARVEELPALQEIERSAARLFAEIGFDAVANLDPLPLDFLQQQQRTGLVWVLAGVNDQPVGFAATRELDGALHLEEIDVHPEHGRRGLGKRLIEMLCLWAERQGYPAITLLTFRDVPWNAPFYSRLGFRVIEEDELGPGLLDMLARETQAWFPVVRVCMRRDLQSEARQGVR